MPSAAEQDYYVDVADENMMMQEGMSPYGEHEYVEDMAPYDPVDDSDGFFDNSDLFATDDGTED